MITRKQYEDDEKAIILFVQSNLIKFMKIKGLRKSVFNAFSCQIPISIDIGVLNYLRFVSTKSKLMFDR